jgi:2-polyprenyl-6-methoxyphenol hydroxylase-like FAD-dependent oxidoreductase
LFRKRGYEVTVYERRPDMRAAHMSAGKSINLAMSARGWKALDLAGLRKDIEELAIPMTGRFLHQPDGSGAYQQYGTNNEAIYSVSRGELNKKLMTLAEQVGAKIYFEHRCTKVEVADNRVYFQTPDGKEKIIDADLLFGSDGAFSALRNGYQLLDRANLSQQYIEHGYKELCIPPDATGAMRMEKNALHIWPRKEFMLIALPNADKSFTATLFAPYHGVGGFDGLDPADADAVPAPGLVDSCLGRSSAHAARAARQMPAARVRSRTPAGLSSRAPSCRTCARGRRSTTCASATSSTRDCWRSPAAMRRARRARCRAPSDRTRGP